MAVTSKLENRKEASSHYFLGKKPVRSCSLFLPSAVSNQTDKVDSLAATKENWPEYLHLERLLRQMRHSSGISPWSSLVFAVSAAVLLVLLLAPRTRDLHNYTYPDNFLRVIQNLDECKSDGSCGYRFVLQNVQRTASGKQILGEPTEMHFCKSMQPRFEAGHVLKFITFRVIGACNAIDSYDTVKGADGLPILAPNCKPDYSTAPVAGHIACVGGKAEF